MIYSGLDLGKLTDHTVWTIDDCDEATPPRHKIRGIKRWPLDTPYELIGRDISNLISVAKIQNHTMAIEVNGPGVPIVEQFEKILDARIISVFTAGGAGVTVGTDDCLHVSKGQVLVATLQAILQSGRLDIANIPGRDVLLQELETFGVEITKAGNETFEAIGQNHDDAVLSLCLACWIAEYGGIGSNCGIQTFGSPALPAEKAARALGRPADSERGMTHAIFREQGRPISIRRGPQPEQRGRFRRW